MNHPFTLAYKAKAHKLPAWDKIALGVFSIATAHMLGLVSSASTEIVPYLDIFSLWRSSTPLLIIAAASWLGSKLINTLLYTEFRYKHVVMNYKDVHGILPKSPTHLLRYVDNRDDVIVVSIISTPLIAAIIYVPDWSLLRLGWPFVALISMALFDVYWSKVYFYDKIGKRPPLGRALLAFSRNRRRGRALIWWLTKGFIARHLIFIIIVCAFALGNARGHYQISHPVELQLENLKVEGALLLRNSEGYLIYQRDQERTLIVPSDKVVYMKLHTSKNP